MAEPVRKKISIFLSELPQDAQDKWRENTCLVPEGEDSYMETIRARADRRRSDICYGPRTSNFHPYNGRFAL